MKTPRLRLHKPTASIEDQAAEWFVRLRADTCSARARQEFQRWLKSDPAHDREYHEYEQLWADLSGHPDNDEIASLRREAREVPERSFPGVRSHAGALRAVAASIAVVGIAALLTNVLLPLQHATYQTEAGDRHTVVLSDDSEVTLNTDSAIRVEYTLSSRRVVLERGQAHFKVSHAVVRPFEVVAGNGTIRALGTAFDVYRHGDDVEVTLMQGKIDVTAEVADNTAGRAVPRIRHAVLTPGQQIMLTPQSVSDVRPASLPKASAWMSGRLVFENERLGDAVQEVNRYSAIKVVLVDSSMAEVRISGVFRAGRAENFVDALKASYPVKVEPANGNLLLSSLSPLPWEGQDKTVSLKADPSITPDAGNSLN